jgi:2-polyprenyl-3-methyl-5-hydroxy-6-metoxy-1,4-benzoquinol methylase
MPTSVISQVEPMVREIMRLRPTSVLDIGFGFGKYGFLCREYLTVWGADVSCVEGYMGNDLRIDGIEMYAPYVTPLQRAVYDDIFIGDAVSVLPRLGHYDLIILSDVLEHFDRDAGLSLIGECKRHATHILVATPKKMKAQGACFGNDAERHIHQFTPDDLKGTVVDAPQTYIVVVDGTPTEGTAS